MLVLVDQTRFGPLSLPQLKRSETNRELILWSDFGFSCIRRCSCMQFKNFHEMWKVWHTIFSWFISGIMAIFPLFFWPTRSTPIGCYQKPVKLLFPGSGSSANLLSSPPNKVSFLSWLLKRQYFWPTKKGHLRVIYLSQKGLIYLMRLTGFQRAN